MAAHNFTNGSLLLALFVTHDYDIICLAKRFLYSPVWNDDERINIKDYNLLSTDHPINNKRISLYYKEHLLIIKTDDLCTFNYGNYSGSKKFFSCLYRSPSQTQHEFEEFCNDLNLILSHVNYVNTTLSVITGYFNNKLSSWWSLDKDNTEGRKINS